MSVTMRSLVFVFLAIPQVFTFIAEPTPNLWDLFKAKHRKNYLSTLEETQRKAIFHENVKFIRAHNEMFEKGKVNFTMAVNRFADLTTKEFLATMTGLRLPRVQCKGSEENQNLTETLGLPSEVDWRKKGAVTAVKDQGQCGSCWAFSTTGSLEGAHFLKTKKLVSLSEQNLVDCDRNDSGCSGGLMDNAFKYIKNNHGIDTEEAYPYTAMDGQCHFNPKSVGATVTGFVDLPCGSEGKLMATVANSGPVSIGIDASLNFQFYSGGVLNDRSCSSVDLNHGVLAVGYGTDPKGGDYWLVKNSWGTSWGMQGYIKMSRNKHNQCGVASAASYPTV